MERRDFLKLSIGSLLFTPFLSEEVFAKANDSKLSKTKGIIFVVGDGFPLGVMKMFEHFMEKKFKEKSNFSYLMKNSHSKIVLQNTSSLSSVVTDSAPASVAWATGSKTANRMLSVLPDGKELRTIFELAKQKGMSCGFVTTTRVTHATPAAWYSHSENRDKEDKIALDLLNSKLDVAMGGGDRYFDPSKRKDGKDLYAEFENKGWKVLKTREELLNLNSTERPILGVFNSSHISYFVDRINDKKLGEKEPTLSEMTIIALKRLVRNPKGFILQIEAGRIDHACHANDAYGAMMDCYELDKTLGLLINFVERNPEVILIVTSDHGNSGFGINGTGPEYNDSTEALISYRNKASFEYIIKKMKNQDLKAVKEIFETYTEHKIEDQEAEEIFKKLNEKRNYISYDIWYEPEATMGKILMASIYPSKGGEYGIERPALKRRGNVGFTSTNHTAEDQLFILYGKNISKFALINHIDNTEVFYMITKHMNIKFENPKMTEEQAKEYIKTVSLDEWAKHLSLHIS
jgi:alkaline phosphatase